ncbi:unnamed protein product [Closterium sp. NIES-65]|nr:unnamed protein product [Closterium sp. NIES-65]
MGDLIWRRADVSRGPKDKEALASELGSAEAAKLALKAFGAAPARWREMLLETLTSEEIATKVPLLRYQGGAASRPMLWKVTGANSGRVTGVMCREGADGTFTAGDGRYSVNFGLHSGEPVAATGDKVLGLIGEARTKLLKSKLCKNGEVLPLKEIRLGLVSSTRTVKEQRRWVGDGRVIEWKGVIKQRDSLATPARAREILLRLHCRNLQVGERLFFMEEKVVCPHCEAEETLEHCLLGYPAIQKVVRFLRRGLAEMNPLLNWQGLEDVLFMQKSMKSGFPESSFIATTLHQVWLARCDASRWNIKFQPKKVMRMAVVKFVAHARVYYLARQVAARKHGVAVCNNDWKHLPADKEVVMSMATSRIALPAAEFPLHVPVGIGGYGVTLEMKDYEVLRDEKAEFTEPCFDLGLAYELDRLGKGDSMILIRGASLRAARTASKADHLIFGSAFGFEALAIPLCTGGGPLPGRHCSVLLVVRPGDLLLPDEEEIGTFYRHLDPKTSSKRHEEEAANVLRFFGECVKAELNRGGRQWTAAPPSAKVLSERLESLAAPIRDVSFQRPCRLVAWAIVVQESTHPFLRRHVLRMLMQKLPDILKEEVAGTGLLAVNAFARSLEHLDDVHRSYDPLIVENPKMVGLKVLRLELLHHAEKAASNKGEAASTVARGVGTAIALGGEEEHEREDVEGGGEHDGGSEEEEDVEREEDDVAVTGEEEAVQFAGEKVADKSGGSGPNLGKKARGSSGSTPTRMASKAAIERVKAAEREIKKLREEKLVAEKRLEFQTARNDTMYGVVTSAVNKLTTVAEGVTHLEQTSGRSIQTAVDAMRAVVQEAVSYRGSTLEFMNTQWLPTVQALHLTATAAQGRRREDDLLLLRGVADALGQKIKTVVSAEAVDQGAEAANVAAATAGPSGSTVEAAVWRAAEEAGGVDEEILASIVMPDPEIEVMREKLQAAAPTVGAQQGAPAASTAPAEDHSAAGAKSPPATTGEDRDGKQKRKGKDKAKGSPAKVGSSKGTSKAAAQGRKGSGVRVDPSNGLAVSEMKFGKKSRYICRSMDKSEAAYYIAVTVSSFDDFVIDVVLEEFGGVKEEVMAQYKADWNVARLIPGGMWMVMWSQGANVFRDRFQQVVAEYNRITEADRAALMLALRPAVWFGDLPESTEPEKAAKKKVASDMIARVSMCAAFAPVAAKVTPIPGVGSERLSEILAGTAAMVWCFSETNATAEVAAGEGGAAATVRGASNEFASRCRTVIEAVLQRAASRVVVVGEVAETVTKDLQAAVVRSLPEVGEEREHDELIARVMIENLAFWGDCNVGGPKLKARGVDLPIDPQMKIIIRDRGTRGQQHKGKQVADA